jgi:hypothetical protein
MSRIIKYRESTMREELPSEIMVCLRDMLDSYHQLFDALDTADDAGDAAEINGRLENLSIRTNGYAHGCMTFLRSYSGSARAAKAFTLFENFDSYCTNNYAEVGLCVAVYSGLHTLIEQLDALCAAILPEQDARH